MAMLAAPLVTQWLDHWALHTPQALFLAERGADLNWQFITYAAFQAKAQRIASGLLQRGLSAERPLVILSGNDREHALLAMGALYAGIPYVPLSPAYSLVSRDYVKLKWLLHKIEPGLVFASCPDSFGPALSAALPSGCEVVFSTDSLHAPATRLVELTPDTVAKILFTSGSTGRPKGVINTHRMLTSNQDALAAVLTRTESSPPPVICDWLAWHHTFGGNHNFNFVLANGGTLYIDKGRPTKEGIEETLRNVADVSPTAYFNVPRGFELLLEHLRTNGELRSRFFHRLEFLFSAGASLPVATRSEFRQIALAATGRNVRFISGFGATETAPLSLFSNGSSNTERFIGKPVPGIRIKLIPVGSKFELCVNGPNVTPGYWKNPGSSSFDEEGFFRTGDAACYADPTDPQEGLCYEGRLSDNFKLASGTWVEANVLRDQVLAQCGSLISDCLIIGEDKPFVSALLFCRSSAMQSSQLYEKVTHLIHCMGGQATGTSKRIERAAILSLPDETEFTDKATLNRDEIMTNRAEVIQQLYSGGHSNPVLQEQRTG
jgi:feruloyl-CoA synthase